MASSKFQEGMHGVFGRISHYRAWIESQMNHSSNYFCDGGLDARDIQPECECGGADGVEVITNTALNVHGHAAVFLLCYFRVANILGCH